ncbi:hypothetical protein AAC387_Pa03g4313 [Persea americana]
MNIFFILLRFKNEGKDWALVLRPVQRTIWMPRLDKWAGPARSGQAWLTEWVGRISFWVGLADQFHPILNHIRLDWVRILGHYGWTCPVKVPLSLVQCCEKFPRMIY